MKVMQEPGYRCALVKFAGDTLSPKATLKVALTQPTSTCGYTKTKVLVNDYLHTNLDTMLYRYVGTHDEVALSIIRGDFQMGGMKESIAKEYASLGLGVYPNNISHSRLFTGCEHSNA